MTAWAGGKGSRYRKTNHQKFSDNWDKIFNKEVTINSTPQNESESVLNGSKEEKAEEEEGTPGSPRVLHILPQR